MDLPTLGFSLFMLGDLELTFEQSRNYYHRELIDGKPYFSQISQVKVVIFMACTYTF